LLLRVHQEASNLEKFQLIHHSASLQTAFIMSKTDVGKHSKLDIVFMIPFMTPPYIGSMGWLLFMQPNGYFEQFFPMLKTISSSFFSLGGMVLIMSLHLFPFLYFMLKNTLLQIGSSKEEAAAVH
ncbi:hypothetical protein ACT453_31715, partial [Bacillus sp. D-CC]